MSKKILILGSTGSIGTQALEVIRENPDKFEVVGLAAAGHNASLLIEQAKEFGVTEVAVANEEAASTVSAALGVPVIHGPKAAEELVRRVDSDTVLNALVGSMGLGATLASLEVGSTLALANKESLVAGGDLVLKKAAPGQLVPVDSEHSAMAQCLHSGTHEELDRLVLTASGGPFRGWTREQMMEVTPEQAAQHPTWSMGQMNTLNSATLVNKGLELIEASLLFGLPSSRIDVVVHPQSIIHSMATFVDGATIAQASPPSMKLPISLALDWPHRVPQAQPALDFSEIMRWDFEPVDRENFPAVDLAAAAVDKKGSFPAVYNAANEEAAEAFLQRKLAFPLITDIIAEVMAEADGAAPRDYEDVLATEEWARARAHEKMRAKGVS
ncbi:MAG: 1-deoxy-D-xylulose-5-phosphate reductoisomerase [Corynebacterium sp.]|nr:1-deoxy-D-xylulose-5-phosphate reductoisomerase [Corynebacterium sp.]